ncbi:MAG: hypothetical protein K0B02_03615 [DPANN group archaeon]|nr:hypothetical protein [DPANN group archaeon]
MDIKYTIGLFTILIFILFNNTFALAAETSDTITVNVNISSVGLIVVTPTALSWLALNPGSDGSVENIRIKNIGSINVSNIYLDTSTIVDEDTNPLLTASAIYYSAAGFIFVQNTTDTEYYHAGRLEWNLSTVLTDEVLDLGGSTEVFGHGWYRNATGNEYLWKVENGTNGLCNNTGTTFNIKNAPENITDVNRDLSTGLSTCGSVTAGTNWGTFACTDGPLSGQCVATSTACDKIHIYKYNIASSFPACANAVYLMEDNLIPGAETFIYVFASIPLGMPSGDAIQGTLTITATY